MRSRTAAYFFKPWIQKIRTNREQIAELRSLLEDQKVAILKPFLESKDAGAQAVSEEVVLDHVNVFRTIRIGDIKRTSSRLAPFFSLNHLPCYRSRLATTIISKLSVQKCEI